MMANEHITAEIKSFKYLGSLLTQFNVGLNGLGATCSPRDPRFACSNPTEVDGFLK